MKGQNGIKSVQYLLIGPYKRIWLVGWLVVGFKADCLTRDLGVWVGCPPWEIFLWDPSPYLFEFPRKPWKTLNGQVDKRDRGMNLASPVYQFLSGDTGGAKEGQFESMPYPGFEPGTFGAGDGFPKHCTA